MKFWVHVFSSVLWALVMMLCLVTEPFSFRWGAAEWMYHSGALSPQAITFGEVLNYAWWLCKVRL